MFGHFFTLWPFFALAAAAASSQRTYRLKHGQFAERSVKSPLNARGLVQLPLQDAFDNYYTIEVQIGTPLTDLEQQVKTMVVDTGSTLFMFGGPYLRQESSVGRDHYRNVRIGRFGSFPNVTSFRDDLILGNITLNNVIINHVEDDSAGTIHGPGIFGIAPALGAARQLEKFSVVDTAIDKLFHAEIYIQRFIISLLFLPSASAFATADTNGIITFGGIDQSIPTGNVSYHQMNENMIIQHKGRYYGDSFYTATVAQFRCQFLTKGGWLDKGRWTYKDLALSPPKPSKPFSGPFLSMSQQIHLPEAVFTKYQHALPGTLLRFMPEIDQEVLILNQTHVDKLGNFTIVIERAEYILTPAAQVVPPKTAARFYGVELPYYVSVFGRVPADMHYDVALGLPFMERYMTVFDQQKSLFGLATTPYTFENTLDPDRFQYMETVDDEAEESQTKVKRRAVNLS